MSESVIADFVARVVADAGRQEEPVRGRVVLSQRRLVLATAEGTKRVPLEAVFDVTVGHVPEDIAEYFDDTVSVRYQEGDAQRTAVVEADPEVVERFGTLLYKTRLEGVRATLVHPAQVGSRLTRAEPREVTLRLGDGVLEFEGPDRTVGLPLGAVVGVERATREGEGTNRTYLRVRHVEDGRSLATEVTLDPAPRRNVLARYVRLEYDPVARELRKTDLPEGGLQALVAVYSGATPAAVLDADAERVESLLADLAESDLLRRDPDPRVTRRGRILLWDRVDAIEE